MYVYKYFGVHSPMYAHGGQRTVTLPLPLSIINSLSQGLLLNLKLGWNTVSSSDHPVSANIVLR